MKVQGVRQHELCGRAEIAGCIELFDTACGLTIDPGGDGLRRRLRGEIRLIGVVTEAGGGRAAPVRQPDAVLRDKMTFELIGDGRLTATGTIMFGTADQFATEIAKRGSYVKNVVLRSPGGSVRDALAMGRLIRQKKFATEVESGRYCASSCPLVFAGGVERRAASNAAIGVHEVAAVGGDNLSAAASMEDAQKISAECQQYLRDMGIDLEVWIHAMETPREELYYFQPAELLALKLATVVDDGKSRSANH